MWKITQVNQTKNNKEQNKEMYREYIQVKTSAKKLQDLERRGVLIEEELPSDDSVSEDNNIDDPAPARLRATPVAVRSNDSHRENLKKSMNSYLKSRRKVIKQDISKETKEFELTVYNKFTNKTYKERFKLKDINDSKTKKELFLLAKNKIRKQIKLDKGIKLGPTIRKLSPEDEVELAVKKGKWVTSFDSSLQYDYDYVQAADYKIGHVNPGDFLNMYHLKKIETIYHDKAPKTPKHHMGIEFEFISKAKRGDIAKALAAAKLHEYVKLTEDGSLRAEDAYPFCHELCVVAPEQELEEVLTKVTDIINGLGSKVNKTCGTHVHIDVRHRDHNVVFNNLTKVQDILFAMQSRERVTNRHCKKIQESDFKKVLAAFPKKGGGDREYRYLGINPHSFERHKTIEVRIHSGTINQKKIINWCKILMAIANKPKAYETNCTELLKFQERFGIDDKLLAYMNSRIKKFNPDGKRHLELEEAV